MLQLKKVTVFRPYPFKLAMAIRVRPAYRK